MGSYYCEKDFRIKIKSTCETRALTLENKTKQICDKVEKQTKLITLPGGTPNPAGGC